MMDRILEICNAFNRHASDYEVAAKVQHEIGSRLFERLHYIKISPKHILDLGCGTGLFTAELKRLYPKANIVSVDLAYNMLLESKKKEGFWQSWSLVNADMRCLPFADNSFDLVFANQVIHWAPSLSQLFLELNRVMSVQGCLMLSTLGPSTFQELRQAWQLVDAFAHTNVFKDMHDVGDELLAQQFLDPVMDMEMLTVHYADIRKLISNLKAQGVRNVHLERNQGLTGRRAWQKFLQNYGTLCTQEKKYPLTYEIVYGHAWKKEKKMLNPAGEVYIPVSAIRR